MGTMTPPCGRTAGRTRLTLLVVDDSAMMRAMIRRAALLTGVTIAHIHEAANGRRALDLLYRHWIDALFTDINMPVMTGIELLQAMAADNRWEHVTRAIISTDGSESRRAEALALGARFYVDKPFRPEAVRDVLLSLSTERARAFGSGTSCSPRSEASPAEGASAPPATFRSIAGCREAVLQAATEVAENSLLAFAEPCDDVGFAAAVAAATGGSTSRWVSASVDFSGPVHGRLQLDVPRYAARRLGASFVGSDRASIGGRAVCDFSGELANMICGTWLTRAWRRGTFRLAPPRVHPCPPAIPGRSEPHRTPICLTIDNAPVRLTICLNEPASIGER